MRDVHVLRPHRGGEPVGRIVREAQRLGLVLEAHHREHRAEDLLACDFHFRPYTVEHGRLDIKATRVLERLMAPERQTRAIRHAAFDVAQHALHVSLIDEGTHLRPGFQRVSESDGGGDAADGLQQRFAHRAVHDQPRARVTGLAAVVVDAPGDAGGGRLEIRVREHHLWRLAAELECHALQIGIGRVAQHQPPDLGRAREGDEIDVPVQCECLAGFFAIPWHDVEGPRRHSRLEGELRQADRGERRLLGGLQYHRVARQERRSHLPAADDEWIVPGHDRADHPERLAADERQVVGTGRRDLVIELVGKLGVVLDAVGAVGDIDAQ